MPEFLLKIEKNTLIGIIPIAEGGYYVKKT
jgi:hypothetical protein